MQLATNQVSLFTLFYLHHFYNWQIMFKNYLVVAIRNLRRNKILSVINVLGLTIGISASLLIFLMVQYDFSFDRFVPGADRVYRIVSDYSFQGNEGHTRGTQVPLAAAVFRNLRLESSMIALQLDCSLPMDRRSRPMDRFVVPVYGARE